MAKGNESVFPMPEGTRYEGSLYNVDGSVLTKRELFAAIAMQGIVTSGVRELITIQFAVEESVRIADALLAELAKVNPNG